MLHEVNVGTSDIVRGGHGGDEAATPQQPPALSVVEEHIQRIRLELCGQRHPPSGYASAIAIPSTAAGLDRVAVLVDLLDQVRYWAIEEAFTFKDEPSRLAETEAPEAVVACLCSQRPQLVAQALRVVQPMLRHRQTAYETRRVMVDVWAYREQVNSMVPLPEGLDPLLAMLAEFLEQHKGVLPVLVEALSTATAALVQDGTACVGSDNGNDDNLDGGVSLRRRVAPLVVALHETTLVYQMESAMRRHPDAVPLQVEGVSFCAALVDLPWPFEAEVDSEEGTPTSLADILAHSDGVLDVLHGALRRHRQNLCIARGVLHVWRVCAQHPANRVPLLQHGAYAGALQQLRGVLPYAVGVWREIAETVGYFIPLLDALQRRSLALTLRELLLRRPQLEMLELILALLLSLLMVVDSGHRGGGGKSSGAFNMYAMYPQPPEAAPSPSATDIAGEPHHRGTKAVLRPSLLQWHPTRGHHPHSGASAAEEDTWHFLLERCAMPQLVSGLLEYFGHCEAVDEEDASDVDRVCRLAEVVLGFF
ncbi:conserved hypothetical protein [Leishmania major strain Friedlin]|uniref:Uncharacterized protein n=1 Tax=Leishmania major TaxID=5664 RepID=Q4QCJ4_LEIMA|nr:conserved hypothetical protein [Leishmania major strain Friedlin]CAG9573276.1 hypothetical_protein_-_conserved [Leishmania major strain Friedlin]CAJ03805.1 conserved hypothetical protein [Leishmania major strain Friedlin]|eukprot:XP_001682954.1 conserved hypothetical protein [Leishmania major strain Friedlin]